MTLDDGIRAAVTSSFASSRAQEDIVSAYLFGSRAAGTGHRESDVDVAVLLDWDADGGRLSDAPSAAGGRFRRRLEIAGDLATSLHRNDVDVVVLNDVPPLFARRILREGTRVWCRDPEADRIFRRDVQLRAADLAPFLARFAGRKLEALRR